MILYNKTDESSWVDPFGGSDPTHGSTHVGPGRVGSGSGPENGGPVPPLMWVGILRLTFTSCWLVGKLNIIILFTYSQLARNGRQSVRFLSGCLPARLCNYNLATAE